MTTRPRALLITAVVVLVVGVAAVVAGRLSATAATDDREAAEAELEAAEDDLDEAEEALAAAEENFTRQRRATTQALAQGEAALPIAEELCDCDGRVQGLFDDMRAALQAGDAAAFNALLPAMDEQASVRNDARDRLGLASD